MNIRGLTILTAVLLRAGAASAGGNELSGAERAAGWELLFDGKTLAGWLDPALRTPPGDSWTIEGGCIKARAKPRIREDLVSEKTYRDFELVFEWRISPGGNSGVKYRIQDRVFLEDRKVQPGARRFEETVDYEIRNHPSKRSGLGPKDGGQEYVIGFEYQVIDNARHPDALRGPKYSAAALYDMIGPTMAAARPIGEFNQARLLVRGQHIEHWLNGVKVVDGSLDSAPVREALAKRWTTASPVYRMLSDPARADCPISLQNHGDEAWFRNLKIRRLPAR